MARSNVKTATAKRVVGAPVVKTKAKGKAVATGNGAKGYERTAKSELFLAAASSFNEDTFYESADERRERFAKLVARNSVINDIEWLTNFVKWLRFEANLRSVPTVVAVEAVRKRLKAGLTGGNRELIRAAVGRIDEVSEVLAYWMSNYGKRIPSAVKRGLADAINDLLNEAAFLKWNGRTKAGSVSLADAINLTHVTPNSEAKSALFKAVLDQRYGAKINDAQLPVIKARKAFLAMSKADQIKALSGKGADKLIKDARLTHEVIAGAIGEIPAKVWANLVPHMGYMALRMNLRRMTNAGIDNDTVDKVCERLRSKTEVERARTMPLDFIAAYRNVDSDDFRAALQRGATHVLGNVPEFKGKTLVLVDRSGSMSYNMSQRGSLSCQDAANMFAAAFALRNDADVFAFDDDVDEIKLNTKNLMTAFNEMPSSRGGTDTVGALEATYVKGKYDRVIILTDEQYGYGWGSNKTVDSALKKLYSNVPVYTWNLAGYKAAHAQSRKGHYTFGGLTDASFKVMAALEAGNDQVWPWETE